MARTSEHHPLRLTILSTFIKHINGVRRQFYRCRCACGALKDIYKCSVDGGLTRSCGCLHREVSAEVGASTKTHGESRGDGSHQESPEYTAWRGLLKRCYLKTHHNYPRYGGAGVTVFGPWINSYETFLAYIGRKPTPAHTVDRWPNPRGNYEPGNVRWATPKEQARNRRNNVMLTLNGKTQCASAWAEENGVDRHLISGRKAKGWTDEECINGKNPITTPKDENEW